MWDSEDRKVERMSFALGKIPIFQKNKTQVIRGKNKTTIYFGLYFYGKSNSERKFCKFKKSQNTNDYSFKHFMPNVFKK